ncbi:hypothetical protein DIPPA_55684 [Diplonema papillatum]|nr:hypothetical protein DIPPA_55684 [Diplonema papillatum]
MSAAHVSEHLQKGKNRRWVTEAGSRLSSERQKLYSGSSWVKRRAKPQLQLLEVAAEGPEAVVELLQCYGVLPMTVVCPCCGETLCEWQISYGNRGKGDWPFWRCKPCRQVLAGSTMFAAALKQLGLNTPDPADDDAAMADKKKSKKGGGVHLSTLQLVNKIQGVSLGSQHRTQDSNMWMDHDTHSRYNKVLKTVTKEGMRSLEAAILPLGGPGKCLEFDEFSVGLQKKTEAGVTLYPYIIYLGIVERGTGKCILRQLPEKWKKAVECGESVELPSGLGQWTNNSGKRVIPPPPPISKEELTTVLNKDMIELGTLEDPLFISTDGAATYRIMFNTSSPEFYWHKCAKIRDSPGRVKYAWVNHGQDQFTKWVSSWVKKDDAQFGSAFTVETDVFADICLEKLGGDKEELVRWYKPTTPCPAAQLHLGQGVVGLLDKV